MERIPVRHDAAAGRRAGVLVRFYDSCFPWLAGRDGRRRGGPADYFLQGAVLTFSNPLTIVFWGGVLAAEVAKYQLTRQALCSFGIGCILSTFFFLAAVATAGTMGGTFLPQQLILLLNGAVGVALLYFGMRLWKK